MTHNCGDGPEQVDLGNLNRIANTSSDFNGTGSSVLTDNNSITTEPGQHHSFRQRVPRHGRIGWARVQQETQSMDDIRLDLDLRRPSQTCPSSPSDQQLELPSSAAPPRKVDQHHQRLRQGSLASDWRFPSMRSPSSPQHSFRGHTPTPPPATTTSTSTIQPGFVVDGNGNGTYSPSPSRSIHYPPTSPSSRLCRADAQDLDLQQNTDPLNYHRLISSDPVSSSRTPLRPKNAGQLHHVNDHHISPSFSSTIRSQSHQLFAASSPSRVGPHVYDDQVAHIGNDLTYNSIALDRIETDRYSNTRRAPDYDRGSESEQQPNKFAPTHHDARFDRQALPLTPVSPASAGPRWDSLPPKDRLNFVQPGSNDSEPAPATAVDAPLSSGRIFPPSPTRTPKSPTFSTGLYSHPYIPEYKPLDLRYESDNTRHEQAGAVTMAGFPERMYRPDSRMSGDTAYSADNYNFSRPRKPSLKSLNPPDFPNKMPLRPGTAKSTASDSLRLESRTMTSSPYTVPHTAYSPSSGHRRQPSAGSNMSSATYTSAPPSMRHQPSQDYAGVHHNLSQIAATGTPVGLPHNVRPQGPPRFYNREGPLAQNQQSHLYEDELRSSVKSRLTASTAQSTLFSEPERASVMTKTSSVFSSNFRNTRQSSFFGPHSPIVDVRDSLSVDDVMGMYEHGFNDSEMDVTRRVSAMDVSERTSMHLMANHMPDHDDSRPGSAMSHNSEAANRLLEAMRETGPTPIPGRSFPLNGDSPVILPDTKAFFRKSLARSIPKDMRLSYISTKSKMDGVYGYDSEKDDLAMETDSARHSRHDSGKMVDHGSEENSPIDDPEKQETTLLATDASLVPNNDSLSPRTPTQPQPTLSQPIQGALQPEDLDPDANDRYGFRKSNQYVTRELYDEWNGPYSEYLARRKKKWESFLKENGLMTETPNRFPQHSAKAKRFVRKGIPPAWRGAAWFYYAGGPKILANNRGVYEQMLKRVTDGKLKEVCREDIERDLYRTFPDNVRFKRGAAPAATGQDSSDPTPAHSRNNSTQSANPLPRAPGSEPVIIEQLRRVLSAFAIFNPSIGYCQSLNFLGGMLLLFVESEEQAFWLLNIITRVYLPGTHEMNLEGSKVDLSVLMAELQTTLPSVWTKISDDGYTTDIKKKPRRRHRGAAPLAADNLPPVTLALTAWFMSCFIGTLPTETTLRVWDVFFYEGSKTLFRVALAIFKAGESEIKAINDPMEVFAVVQTLPRKMLDANLLMETCFKRRSGLGHITSEEIDRSRTESREKLHGEQREKVAAAQAGPGLLSAATISINRQPSDLLSVKSGEGGGPRRKHLFGRRAHTGTKERSGSEV